MEQESEYKSSVSRDKKHVISDPETIRMIFQRDNLQILNILLREAKNIQELKEATGINPGTIKRNLDKLKIKHLVIEAGTKKSNYNITMRYYIASAEEFEINFNLPVEDIRPYLEKNEND